MSQSSDSLPILTLSNWYSWEQRAINAIANFGEAGKAIINNIPYVLEEPCQSAVIQYRQQYVDPADGLSKIRVAERPWSDAMDWSTLAHQVAEYNTLKAKHQSQRQSLWSFLTTHLDDEVDNLVKVHALYEQASATFDTDLLWIILRQCATVHGTFQHAQIRNQWANFKQSTYDSEGNVLSTMPLSKFILRFQGYVDQMKGHPTKPTEVECTDTLLSGINCSRYSIVWHKYSGPNSPKPSYANLKAELFQSEKYLPMLSGESILVNTATSTSSAGVSSKSTPVIMKAAEAQEFNPDIAPPKPGQCAMCGAMKATHPTGCPQYGIICKACGNIGHALLFCRKVMSLNKPHDLSKSHSNKSPRSKNKDSNKKRKAEDSASDED